MYHAQGIRPVPACLMAIAKLPTIIKVNQDSKQDVTAQGPCPHRPQTQNDIEHHEGLRTDRDNRENNDDASDDMASNFEKHNWRNIAKLCDVACFVLFLGFHLLFIIVVVAMLLKDEQTPDYWNDQHSINVIKQLWKKVSNLSTAKPFILWFIPRLYMIVLNIIVIHCVKPIAVKRYLCYAAILSWIAFFGSFPWLKIWQAHRHQRCRDVRCLVTRFFNDNAVFVAFHIIKMIDV